MLLIFFHHTIIRVRDSPTIAWKRKSISATIADTAVPLSPVLITTFSIVSSAAILSPTVSTEAVEVFLVRLSFSECSS